MNLRQLAAPAAAVLALGATALTGITPATAGTPTDTGCATAYQLLAVDGLTAQGYGLPALLDEGGNTDGFVCGKAFNQRAATNICSGDCGVPVLYNFYDNGLTPAH